jgi:hypothetical protein
VVATTPPSPPPRRRRRRSVETGPCGRPGVVIGPPGPGRPATPEARPHAGSPRGFDTRLDSSRSIRYALVSRPSPRGEGRFQLATDRIVKEPLAPARSRRPRPDAFGRSSRPFQASQPAVSFRPDVHWRQG